MTGKKDIWTRTRMDKLRKWYRSSIWLYLLLSPALQVHEALLSVLQTLQILHHLRDVHLAGLVLHVGEPAAPDTYHYGNHQDKVFQPVVLRTYRGREKGDISWSWLQNLRVWANTYIVKMVVHVSLKYLRRGGPKSTASSAFRLSFCLCRWSNIFSCIDINDGSFAAILKYGEGEKSVLKTEFLFHTVRFQRVLVLKCVQSKNMLFKCFDVALAGSYKRFHLDNKTDLWNCFNYDTIHQVCSSWKTNWDPGKTAWLDHLLVSFEFARVGFSVYFRRCFIFLFQRFSFCAAENRSVG